MRPRVSTRFSTTRLNINARIRSHFITLSLSFFTLVKLRDQRCGLRELERYEFAFFHFLSCSVPLYAKLMSRVRSARKYFLLSPKQRTRIPRLAYLSQFSSLSNWSCNNAKKKERNFAASPSIRKYSRSPKSK